MPPRGRIFSGEAECTTSMAATLRWEPSWSSIPDDIALKIASFLEAADVCSLGSCSRFWHGLCASECLWMELAKRRWPMMDLGSASSGSSQSPGVSCRPDEIVARPLSAESRTPFPPVQGCRELYIYKHQTLARAVSAVKEFVEQCTQNESLEAGYYLKAVSDLHSYRLGFKDVQVFLFAKSCSVLLNLIGLHYCLQLEIAPSEVMEALCRSQVSEREICVRWFKLGRWFYGFRLQDEHHSRKISLGELVMGKDDEVIGVLNRGAVHEVIRVHITKVNPETAASNSVAVSTLLLNLHTQTRFYMKNLGSVSYFLGIQITAQPIGHHLNQSKYMKELLEKAGICDCKQAATPLATSSALESPLWSLSPILNFIGSLAARCHT